MSGQVNITAFDGILMNIFQFLNQYRFTFNYLWMAAFFPYLIFRFCFVGTLKMLQQT